MPAASAATQGLPTMAVLVTPYSTASVAYGLTDLFHSAGRDWPIVVDGRPGPPALRPITVGRQAGPMQVANGAMVQVSSALADCRPDVVIVPDLQFAPDEPVTARFADELAWLQRCHAAGSLVTAACTGAMLLAAAGLLENEDATTHWAFCDAMQQLHPGVRVRPQRSLVVSGEGQRLVMAGGGTSWMDLALYLIARLVSIEAATHVARVWLIDWHQVGQQPFARVARTRQSDDAVIGRCQSWIADNYASAAPVSSLIALSQLPERSFQRRFKLATGLTPLEYVHTLRIEEAKHLLETTALPIEAIAEQVGYEDAAFFGRLFRRKVQLSAPQYRRRFGGLREALMQA
ncbi:GlxA family transcriptional regulator [Roseateles cavernae]|uniref:GlxA family transcriptional regulator n=1 Tax=Roseateles cavernae TaxID=3153578 RepID=UPI0032E3FEF6